MLVGDFRGIPLLNHHLGWSLKALLQSLSQYYADLATRRTVFATWKQPSRRRHITAIPTSRDRLLQCDSTNTILTLLLASSNSRAYHWHVSACMTLWPYVLTIRTAAYCLGLSFEHQETRGTWSSRHKSGSSKGISSKPLLLTFVVLLRRVCVGIHPDRHVCSKGNPKYDSTCLE